METEQATVAERCVEWRQCLLRQGEIRAHGGVFGVLGVAPRNEHVEGIDSTREEQADQRLVVFFLTAASFLGRGHVGHLELKKR